jgi:hypothetical protein
VGNADFVMFDRPGRFTMDRPGDGLTKLLRRLTVAGPGILAETRVLYVEGDWDVELIELLHGDLLARHNILLSRMNGVQGASLAASSVWQRMMLTPFGVMFDVLYADDVARTWTTLRDTVAAGGRRQALRSLRQKIKLADQRDGRYEDVELLRLFTAVLDGGLEERMHLVMHGLSDIFQVMHPSVFGLSAKSWRDAGYDGRGSFKNFVPPPAPGLHRRRTARRRRISGYAAPRAVRVRGRPGPLFPALTTRTPASASSCSRDAAPSDAGSHSQEASSGAGERLEDKEEAMLFQLNLPVGHLVGRAKRSVGLSWTGLVVVVDR